MKKNISINISGIIFHIEEDGYDSLRKYLDSINRYFGSFEDSSEILSDIESRIAEIFLSKLNEGKQVITLDDVNSLIATMGNVNDFRAAEEQEVETASPKQEQRQQKSSGQSASDTVHKKLYRDEKRKILGGVCAGLGHYFSIDPVWPRVLFALLVLGSYGGLLLVYMLMWIVIPNAVDLQEDTTIKKMYRDPEKKVLGGVASGVAAFFGVDVTVIRVLFVVFIFIGGLGLILYIILWIALPQANSITEKMEMQGEPVTLSNIESTVKKGINEKGEDESTLAKIILFPFRILAAVLSALGKILGPVLKLFVDVLRVFLGLLFVVLGLSLLVSLIISFGIFFDFFGPDIFPASWGIEYRALNWPIEAIHNTFPIWLFVVAFIALVIPCLSFILSGSSVIANRKIVGAPVAWSFGGVFFICVIILALNVPRIVYSFKEDAEYKTEKQFAISGKTVLMKVVETGLDDYRVTDLTLRGYDGKDLKLVQRFISQGSTRKSAIENAQMVDYNVIQKDSVLEFDSNITFKKNAKFHAQRLEMMLYLPYHQKFKVDREMWRLIDNYNQYDNDDDDTYYNGYQYSDYNNSEEQTWEMTEDGLKCITCPAKPKSEKGLDDKDQYGLRDFSEVEVQGIFDLRIQQSERFSIELDGPEREKRKYKVSVSGETLEIDYENRGRTFWEKDIADDRLKITILLPSLSKLKITGAGEFKIVGFDEEEMNVTLKGAMVGDGELKVENMDLKMTGPMVFELDGEGESLQAEVTGLAQLKAGQYEVQHAVVEAKKLGRARVNASNTLEMDTDAVSSIKYQGNPEVTRRD